MNFSDKNILVIGDIMLDKYIFGNVSRINPEAPVPIVKINKEKYTPGGAANVANNIVSLGANAYLIGLIGDDEPGKILKQELEKSNIKIFLLNDGRQTTFKIRTIAQNQQLLRIDYENEHTPTKEIEDKIIDYIKSLNLNIIIISDYAKGTITNNIVNFLKTLNIPIIVDPKPKNKEFYKDVFLIKPNYREAIEMTHLEDVEQAGKALVSELNTKVLITKGEHGMFLFNDKITRIPTKAKEVYDITGAGDTVIAVLALTIASDYNLEQAADIANHAAAINLTKLGAVPIKLDEIANLLNKQ